MGELSSYPGPEEQAVLGLHPAQSLALILSEVRSPLDLREKLR